MLFVCLAFLQRLDFVNETTRRKERQTNLKNQEKIPAAPTNSKSLVFQEIQGFFIASKKQCNKAVFVSNGAKNLISGTIRPAQRYSRPLVGLFRAHRDGFFEAHPFGVG